MQAVIGNMWEYKLNKKRATTDHFKQNQQKRKFRGNVWFENNKVWK